MSDRCSHPCLELSRASRQGLEALAAFAPRRVGIATTIVVPHGNSLEKNRAMRALGAELVEHGDDFYTALLHSRELAMERQLHAVPSYHSDLVIANAASAVAFLRHAPP